MSSNIRNYVAVLVSIVSIGISLLYSPISSKLPDFSSVLIGTVGAVVGSLIAWLIIRSFTGKEKRILFLFPNEETEIANKIAQDLIKMHVKVLLENELFKPGDNIQDAVKEIIKSIDTILVINSRNHEEKKIQKMILSIAKNNNKKIIPVTTVKSRSVDNNIKGSDFSAKYTDSFDDLVESIAS